METSVTIPGIHCASCAMLIQDVSKDFPSIERVEVDTEKKTVILHHGVELDKTKWKEEIESLGADYKVQSIY